MRFRPNLVISGGRPYAEDEWRNIKIGNKCFRVSSPYNRCKSMTDMLLSVVLKLECYDKSIVTSLVENLSAMSDLCLIIY